MKKRVPILLVVVLFLGINMHNLNMRAAEDDDEKTKIVKAVLNLCDEKDDRIVCLQKIQELFCKNDETKTFKEEDSNRKVFSKVFVKGTCTGTKKY